MDSVINQVMYQDRKLVLLNDWREATKSGKIEDIYAVHLSIKQFVSDVTTDTTTPDETKEQADALLKLIEKYIEERTYTFTT